MTHFIKTIFTRMKAITGAGSSWRTPTAPLTASSLSPALIIRQKERAERCRPELLTAALGLRPGLSVLDIGAGAGAYDFIFDSEMNGSGAIVATDSDPEKTAYLGAEVLRRGLSGISPVTIKPDGSDLPGRKGGYDLILMAHTHGYISDRPAYYRRLPDLLAPGGVFALLGQRDFPDFSEEDITDPTGLAAALSSLPAGDIFRANLEKNWPVPGASPAAVPARVLAKALNSLIANPDFHVLFLDGQGGFRPTEGLTEEELWFIGWVLRFVTEEDGALGRDGRPITGIFTIKHSWLMRKVRHVLVSGKFRRFINGGTALYLPGGPVYSEKLVEKKEVSEAGFILKAQHGFIPFELLLVFGLPGLETGRGRD